MEQNFEGYEGKRMLKIAVCDDETYYLNRIVDLLKRELKKRDIRDYIIEEYVLGTSLLKENRFLEYDIVFLDINMPEINGLKIAERIREIRTKVILVFVTAFIDYALEGYKTEAIRFLLKDTLEQTMPECVEAITRKLALQTYKMKCSCREGEKEIPIDRICYIESKAHRLFFNILENESEQYNLYDKLDNMEEQLSMYGFLRIHKSFLVNTKYIEEIVNYVVWLKDGRQLPVPRERFKQVKEMYYEIMGDIL